MSRKIVAGFLVGLLPAAALMGFALHLHPDDHDTTHHAAHAVHFHFSGHDHGGLGTRHDGHPVFDDMDGRAVYFATFVGEATTSFQVNPAIPVAIEVPAPEVHSAQPPLLVVHGHDPPGLSQLSPRAPPSFLS